jgi:hypothetical protein
MTLISFQHSIKYIYLQLAPYAALTALAGYKAAGLDFLWFIAYLALSALLAWRMISLAATQYFFTHDMLIVSRGLIFKQVDCVALWQLQGTDVRGNRLMRWLHISHVHCGLEGPPADRVRIVGVDNYTMLQILQQLKEGIAANKEMWRSYFQPASA